MHRFCNRRTFLKASLFTSFALLHGRNTHAGLSPGKHRPSRLHLYNIHTGEQVKAVFRDQNGHDHRQGIDQLNWLLRCHFTNEQHAIDLRTLHFLKLVDNAMGGDNEIHVISGYRSPNYNDRLLKLGHKVAKNSLHLSGRAIDIRIPGQDLPALRQAALSLCLGGVGYYPRDNFVHLDSGSFRSW